MKASFFYLLVLVGVLSAAAADKKEQELAQADSIEVWDQRVSALHAKPVKIIDRQSIQAVVSSIEESKAKWKKGWGTSPSGYLRFVFCRGNDVIVAIGLGEGFLVRGGGGDWESQKISKEIETKLDSFGQKKEEQNK